MATAVNRAGGASAAPAPLRFFELHVVRAERLSSGMARVTFGGEQLQGFASGGRDQGIKLFLPQAGQDAPVVPTNAGERWFAEWRAMDPAVRAIARSYTVRAQRRDPDELDIDFVLHAGGGAASRWAARARPGDRVTVLGPVANDNRAVRFRPPHGTDWVLIAADETALPAAAGILEALPAGVPAKVWIEVPHMEDQQDLPTRADTNLSWLARSSTNGHRPGLTLDAVRSAELPRGNPYAWVAGEATTVRGLRRHLFDERGFDRQAVTFTGYWRLGATADDRATRVASGRAVDSGD